MQILAINGSYRQGGITDQILAIFERESETYKTEIEVIYLRDYHIDFCLNCRACCQEEGTDPGECLLDDDMIELIAKIQKADGYIFASPTNFYTVTAIYKKFLERLLPYAHWPWGMNAPKIRKSQNVGKKAVLVSSCAAPGFIGKLVYGTHRLLKITAKTIGAKVAGTLFIGMISKEPDGEISKKTEVQIGKLLSRLVE